MYDLGDKRNNQDIGPKPANESIDTPNISYSLPFLGKMELMLLTQEFTRTSAAVVAAQEAFEVRNIPVLMGGGGEWVGHPHGTIPLVPLSRGRAAFQAC